jgi:hypothetical protein
MRIRTLAAALVAAAGLSVTLTGAAGAATPPEPPAPAADVFVVTCTDGRATVRPATEEDRERLEKMRAEAGGEKAVLRGTDAAPGRPGDGRVVVYRAFPPGAKPADGGDIVRSGAPGDLPPRVAQATCAAPAEPAR